MPEQQGIKIDPHTLSSEPDNLVRAYHCDIISWMYRYITSSSA